jgi:predicted permease
MGTLLRRLQYLLHLRQSAADLSEELALHRALRQEKLEEAGLTATDAAAASRRALGNDTLAREDARAVWIWPWLESVWQDAAFAARSLRRQPGFSLLAILTLGSAIGVNVSLFTAYNALTLRPWAVADPARVVNVFSVHGRGHGGFSAAEFRHLSSQARTFSGLVATRFCGQARMDDAALGCSYVSGNYFGVLGVQMERGRGFLPEEDRVEAPAAVTVLSHGAWIRHLGGAPDVVGRSIRLDGIPFTIVGVAARTFPGTTLEPRDLWVPLSAMGLLRPHEPGWRDFLTRPEHCCVTVAGRLAPDVPREQARAELAVLSRAFRAQPALEAQGVLLTPTALVSDPDKKRRQILPVFGLMFVGVTLVLLLACANVSNLLLARAVARRREIAVRLSLGAGRRRLIRQFLTEGLVLAGAASLLGLAVASFLPRYIIGTQAPVAPPGLAPDGAVLGYTVVVAALACLVFSLAPALHATRGSVAGALKDARLAPGSRISLRGALLAVQVAVSVVLLIGASLLTRGVQHANSKDPGFAVDEVNAVSVELPPNAYDEAARRVFVEQMVHALGELPGARPFGLATSAPFLRGRHSTGVRLQGEDEKQARSVQLQTVSPGYFDVLRIPIVAGRNFEPGDHDRDLVLVNETMAREYWPNESAVGRVLVTNRPREVVGVVKDAYTADPGLVEATLYQPTAGSSIPQFLVRKEVSSQAIGAIAARLDPRVQVEASSLAARRDLWLSGSRFGATLAGALGGLALVLASIGMFGVFGYVVQQRTPEIGIRMALGARPRQAIALVLGSAWRALSIGLGLGLLGALGGSRILRRELYGISPFDPYAYLSVFLLLAVAAMAATYLPARRATRVDPAIALRYE